MEFFAGLSARRALCVIQYALNRLQPEHDEDVALTTSPENHDRKPRLDLIWGAAQIADAIGITTRQANNLLDKRALPARKVGGRWVAKREVLANFFNPPDGEAA